MKLGTLKDSRAIAVQDAGSDCQFVALNSLGFNGSLQNLLPDDAALSTLQARLHNAEWQPLELEQLAVPITAPPKIICVGLNYRRHALEAGMAVPTQPVVFTRFLTTLVNPFDAVQHDSSLTQQLDYEVELAVVIGRGGKRIARKDALGHVFGYTVCNDISARDLQLGPDTGGQWTRGKNLDMSCPLGPWIVTRDELPDPQRLRLRCEVNGSVLQDSSTADMIFSVEEIVHRLSHWFTLQSGDVIITGTPEGVGFTRQPPIFLRPGDHTSAWIEGIGAISNQIVAVGHGDPV